MSCGTEIAARDNVPLLSYALLRGRCRHCDARIPLRYPLVELSTALLIVACVLRFGLTFYTLIAAFFCVVLVVLSAIDLEHRIVPNRIVLPAAAIVLAAQLLREPSLEWPLAALGAAGGLFLVALAYPKGLGMGDVKLALLLGAMLGRNVFAALFIGFLAGLVPSLVLFARHGRQARKMAIPLVPFLALGAVIALFWGNDLVGGYADLFD